VQGTVYLLHFAEPYGPGGGANGRGTARHYTGWARGGARGLARRLARHGTSEGARLMQVVREAGITWELARTWPGDRNRERQLKRQGGAARRCPLCGVTPQPGDLPTNADGSISRARTTDLQKEAAGVMTAAQQAEHTALRRGATGRTPPRQRPRVRRLRPSSPGEAVDGDDLWAAPGPAGAPPAGHPDAAAPAPVPAARRRPAARPVRDRIPVALPAGALA